MKKRFLSLLIAMSVVAMPTGALANENSIVKRLCGKDRYDTSISIAKEFIKNMRTIDSVILASGENFPDALSGTTLCNKYNAPLLLINDSTKEKILNFIYKNLSKGKTVYILGGEGVVNQLVSKELQSKGYKVKRLWGKNRYETNNEIVKEMQVRQGTSVFVCNANSFADALSASPVAGNKGFPILLVDKNYVTEETMEQIKKINPVNIYFIGGTGVISENTVNKILKVLPNSKSIRIEGKDRYATSEKLNELFSLDSEGEIAIADGRNYPDALSGSALASIKNIGIKLVNPYIDNKQISKNTKIVDVLGGEGVVPSEVVNKIIYKPQNKPVQVKPVEKPSTTIKPVVKKLDNRNELTEQYKKAVCNRMVELVNELRKSQGVGPLKDVDTLNKLAENRSIYMAETGEFSHTDRSGNFIFQQDLDKINYDYRAVGENIAQNFYDANPNVLAEKLFTQWKNSPGHYRNMIGSQFNQIGFGISIKSNGEVYATQGFVGR